MEASLVERVLVCEVAVPIVSAERAVGIRNPCEEDASRHECFLNGVERIYNFAFGEVFKKIERHYG